MTFCSINEIKGVNYATYGHSTIGLKEEVVGKVKLTTFKSSIPKAIIDFKRAKIASDLWLFRQITAFGENWQDLVVMLTPEGGKALVWYEFVPEKNLIIIYGDQALTVSYRLIAPRFDWPGRATNLSNGGGGLFVR